MSDVWSDTVARRAAVEKKLAIQHREEMRELQARELAMNLVAGDVAEMIVAPEAGIFAERPIVDIYSGGAIFHFDGRQVARLFDRCEAVTDAIRQKFGLTGPNQEVSGLSCSNYPHKAPEDIDSSGKVYDYSLIVGSKAQQDILASRRAKNFSSGAINPANFTSAAKPPLQLA